MRRGRAAGRLAKRVAPVAAAPRARAARRGPRRARQHQGRPGARRAPENGEGFTSGKKMDGLQETMGFPSESRVFPAKLRLKPIEKAGKDQWIGLFGKIWNGKCHGFSHSTH